MNSTGSRITRRGAAVLCSAAMTLALGGSGAGAQPAEYRNPISKTFADTFADPAIIRAKDGYWYAYGTSDPLTEGENDYHLLPTARSDDLVSWDYVGDAFDDDNAPVWMDVPEMWAPDIRYFNGRYYLYYVVTETTVTEGEFDSAIGVATAPTPVGPWTDSGEPLVGPRPGDSADPDDFKWTFDPALVTDERGHRYLYYGSYYGGIFATRLAQSGLRTVGKPTQVAINDRYEGAYVVHRKGHYYLFASSTNCCAGPTTGYSVFVGRANDPLGPFVDKQGNSMTESRVGGSIVVTPNGNTWVGTGHNAIVTDLAGQDWFVYHAIDRSDPFLDEPFGVNQRPMLMDRLDWRGGWPKVRAGRWASETPRPAPDTTWEEGSEFNQDRSLAGQWAGSGGPWRLLDRDSGGFVRRGSTSCDTSYLVSRNQAPGYVRAEADVRLRPGDGPRGRVGLVAAYRGPGRHLAVYLDAGRGFVTEVLQGNTGSTTGSSLPKGFRFEGWHHIALEVRGRRASVEVTDARLFDPVAEHSFRLPRSFATRGSVGVAAACRAADADNVGATRLYRSIGKRPQRPAVGERLPAFSDAFNGSEIEGAWSWIRSPAATQSGGKLVFPAQDADLFEDNNTASVLVRPAPLGRYTVQTKLAINLGKDTDRSFEQGGLVIYDGDDRYIKLVHVAIFNTRQTEYAKEIPFAGGVSYGAMNIGTPGRETWLRISHRVDQDNGEHEYRAATSRNGRAWTWGGTWTMPPDARPQLGLVSMGGDGSTSRFEYFKVKRP